MIEIRSAEVISQSSHVNIRVQSSPYKSNFSVASFDYGEQ
jgi:hypothetical protein